MIKKAKLIFIDLDGTLIDKGKGVSQQNYDAIIKQIKAGKKIVVSTGRLDGSPEEIMKRAGLDCVIKGNGSLIVDRKGKILHELSIDKSQTKKIIQKAQQHGLIMRVDRYREFYGVTSKIKKHFVKKHNFIPLTHWNIVQDNPIHKILLSGKLKSGMSKALKDFREVFNGKLSITTSFGGMTIELTHIDATKGKAEEIVSKIYKITKREERIHIGDSMNDASTAGVCQLIALKHAPQRLKDVSDAIGPHYKDGGVAKILNEEFKLIVSSKSI